MHWLEPQGSVVPGTFQRLDPFLPSIDQSFFARFLISRNRAEMGHERKVQQSRGLHKEQLHHLHRRHENHHARNAERREQHKEGDLRVVVVVHDAVIHNVAVKVVGL